MKSIYGRSVFTSPMVSANRCASSTPSLSRIAPTTSREPRARTRIAPSIRTTIVITERASAAAASRDDLSSSPLKTGTNAAVSAPSPKSLRIMFGSANARVNALCATPAPIRRDWSISRTSPSTRESAVNAPTVNAFFSMPCPLPLIS